MGTNGLKFNSGVQIQTMFINGSPVTHMVDQATHFLAAAFLERQTLSEIWETIKSLWNLVNLGPPHFFMVYQGSNYNSREFKGILEANGRKIGEAPVPLPGDICTVERYHAPFRVPYGMIITEPGKKRLDDECQKMALFPVNVTVGPEGWCQTHLVFRPILMQARSSVYISHIYIARYIHCAMVAIEKKNTGNCVAFGLTKPDGQK